MSYELCGKCLHARSTHTTMDSPNFMYCGKCMRACDMDEYIINHKPSMITCNDGVAYDLSGMRKKEAKPQ